MKIATRGSELARWQANAVRQELEGLAPGGQAQQRLKQGVVDLGDKKPADKELGDSGEAATAKPALGRGVSGELVIVSTAGDRDLASSLSEIGGKGVFVKEVQAAVLAGEADIAVHSAKDMPAETPEGLTIGAVLKRGDPRDALVGCRLADLPNGATVATGAPRRRAQLAALRPDLNFAELRGNIATRLAKAGNYDAIVVAVAALERLGFVKVGSEAEDGITEGGEAQDRSRSRASSNLNLDTEVEGIGAIDGVVPPILRPKGGFDTEVEGIGAIDVLNPETFIPQVGQGTIAIECRSDDIATRQLLATINHSPTRICLEAERCFLQALGGDCNLPAGAYATLSHHQQQNETPQSEPTLHLAAFLATFGGTLIQDSATALLVQADSIEVSLDTASKTGIALARSLLSKSN